MKKINDKLADSLQSGWSRLPQEKVNNCFEKYDQVKEEYNRITGVDFGPVNPRPGSESNFYKGIKNWGPDSNLSFNMGVDFNEHFNPYFEMKGKYACTVGIKKHLTQTFISAHRTRHGGHIGVSVDYKNEVCSNWALIPYYMVSRIFFQTISLDGGGQGIKVDERTRLLQRPKRVRKFIIQEEDIQAMRAVIQEKSHIKVHFGVNYGHSANKQIAFTPVIEISNSPELTLDDDGGTYLDFVHACPPTCG